MGFADEIGVDRIVAGGIDVEDADLILTLELHGGLPGIGCAVA